MWCGYKVFCGAISRSHYSHSMRVMSFGNSNIIRTEKTLSDRRHFSHKATNALYSHALRPPAEEEVLARFSRAEISLSFRPKIWILRVHNKHNQGRAVYVSCAVFQRPRCVPYVVRLTGSRLWLLLLIAYWSIQIRGQDIHNKKHKHKITHSHALCRYSCNGALSDPKHHDHHWFSNQRFFLVSHCGCGVCIIPRTNYHNFHF